MDRRLSFVTRQYQNYESLTMSQTRRQSPRNGQFKKLKASTKKQRNKKQRAVKANLQIFVKPSKKYINLSTGLENIREEYDR